MRTTIELSSLKVSGSELISVVTTMSSDVASGSIVTSCDERAGSICQTTRQQDAWLLKLIPNLRRKCIETYGQGDGFGRWECRKINYGGLSKKQTFDLRCDHLGPKVRVCVGVFFDKWNSNGTPLWIVVKRSPDAGVAEEEYGVHLHGESVFEATMEEAVEAFIEKLDEVLYGLSEGRLATTPELTRLLDSWDEYRERLEAVCHEIPDLVCTGSIQEVTFDTGLTCSVVDADFQIIIAMRLLHWAERAKTPCWLEVYSEKRACTSRVDVRHRSMTSLPFEGERLENGWLIPVPLDLEPDKFADRLKGMLENIVLWCQKRST